jgi:hypothetical protein
MLKRRGRAVFDFLLSIHLHSSRMPFTLTSPLEIPRPHPFSVLVIRAESAYPGLFFVEQCSSDEPLRSTECVKTCHSRFAALDVGNHPRP